MSTETDGYREALGTAGMQDALKLLGLVETMVLFLVFLAPEEEVGDAGSRRSHVSTT